MDNNESNKSINAAATRKRRSSILKNQRPPRTPFSELEFKVATPTDTTKSRRVSFSKRTGVAEFVTNEATTTWKNFYEEHNKSLESSGNELASNTQKPVTIGQIGRSIFDQQFDDVVAVDLGGSNVPTNSRQDFQRSLNNANFTQQLAALECTGDDRKLTLPQQNFDLSALTDHQSKLFGDGITCPDMTEMSNPLNVNFSVMQSLDGKCDDLDEIQQDLKRAQQNVICPGPVFGGNMSEYIEVDLNMTHVGLKNDDYDMSITDTICSPKVQVPKKSLHKSITDINLEDKENLGVTPFAPLKETDNFAVNEELDKILVFDGKRLTMQMEKKLQSVPKPPELQPRRTIVLNTDDDLPNFISPTVRLNNPDTVIYDEENLSMTQTLESKIGVPRRKTIVFDDDKCNISMTQTVPAKVIVNEKRRTIVDENFTGNISITQAIPTNIICSDNLQKTVVYDDDNISFTQALPANLIQIKKHDGTIHFQNNDISFTQAIPQNIVQTKRHTFCNEVDISMTQAIPTNILVNKENDGKTILYDDDMDVSMTQAVPQSILLPQEKQKTVIYDKDDGDVSLTEALPVKTILPILENVLIAACDGAQLEDVAIPETESDCNEFTQIKTQDISMTQALPPNIILPKQVFDTTKTTVYADANMSTTQVLPDGVLIENIAISDDKSIYKEKTIDLDEEKLHKEVIKESKDVSIINKTIGSKCDMGNLSITKPIPSDIQTLQTDLEKIQSESKSIAKSQKSKYEKQDILVYQSKELNKSIINGTEQGDSENEQAAEANLMNESDTSLKKEYACDNDIDKTRKCIISKELNSFTVENIDLDKKSKVSCATSLTSQNSLKPKKSILNELLDMSTASSDHCNDDKNVMAVIETPMNVEEDVKSDNSSRDSVFVIRRDSNDDAVTLMQQELERSIGTARDMPQIESKTPALEYKAEENIVKELKNKIDELKASAKNRPYEEIKNTQINTDDKLTEEFNVSRGSKSIKTADDTRELLQMLSEFTDRRSIPGGKDEPEIERTETDCKRISFAPKSRPTLSREDFLSNISMAQAALQQSRFEVDSDSFEETDDSPNDVIEIEKSGRKSLRISSDVVKALQFDESASEMNDDVEMSPLKKTAFGETSYMKEAKHEKTNVIPTYDVSDGIKELMSDLVKPMADVLPFESGPNQIETERVTKKNPSTISTQIQANLITSSQIDLDVELNSNPESMADIKRDLTLMDEIARLGNRAVSSILKHSVSPVSMDVSIEEVHKEQSTPRKKQSIPGQVILFDQKNPLNNVLVSSMDYENAHPYNPIKSNETITSEKRSVQFSDSSSKENKLEVERVSTQYNVDIQNLPSGDTCSEKPEETQSVASNASKPLSIDRSTEGIAADLKHTEINTEIAMKKNKELLEANSSLTLVDDTLARSTFDEDMDSRPQSEDEVSSKKSALRVIYKMDKNGVLSEKMESNDGFDLISNDGEFYEDIQSATRKRSYSPTRQEKNKPNTDLTPKPLSKVQKISNSPNVIDDVEEKKEGSPKKNVPEKKSPKKLNNRKPSVTVQQLLTEYNIVDIDHKTISDEVDHALKNVMSIDSELKERIQTVTSYSTDIVTETSESDPNLNDKESDTVPVNWQKEPVSEQSSRNLFGECESSANVVAKINMLPFMGSPECEWEGTTGDVWSFLLLRSRVRVCARLAHSHLNAPRSRVRADTPVLSVTVDPVREDEKDPLISLCIRLATEAMRYECSRSCSRAGEVSGALKRCVGVAKIALKWVRAMRDAMLRLAFTVTKDGCLTLKVANVPLRSVWELSMRIELVVEDAQQTAWPRAGSVRLATIVADETVPTAALRRVAKSVPHDWGHAPRTVWKLFKYLKHKMRDEDLCGLNILNTLKCK